MKHKHEKREVELEGRIRHKKQKKRPNRLEKQSKAHWTSDVGV